MIDFTNCSINKFKYYGGRNGGKICITYNNEDYMLKFPGINEGIKEHGYSNSCLSEYLACNIIKTLGFKVQDTILGTYKLNNTEKVVVACKDFTSEGKVLKQFAELKNSQIETSKNGYGTELSEVIETIENQLVYDANELKKFFWDMFIADCLVGNFDRHNGNWGFLSNEKGVFEIAPILDCASCLFPSADDDLLKTCLNDKEQLEMRIYTFPNSAIKINGKKINPYEFIISLNNEDCNKALLEIFPKIDMKKIYNIIDNVEEISDIRKQFLKVILTERYSKILKSAYEKLFNTD